MEGPAKTTTGITDQKDPNLARVLSRDVERIKEEKFGYDYITHAFHDFVWPNHEHEYLSSESLVDDSIISNWFKFRIVHKEFAGIGSKLQAAENAYTYSYMRFGLYFGDFNTYTGVGGRVFFPSGSSAKMIDGFEFGGSLRTPMISTSIRWRLRGSTGFQRYNPIRFGLTTERTFIENGRRIRSTTFLNPAASLGLPGTGHDVRLFEDELLPVRKIYQETRQTLLSNRSFFEKFRIRRSNLYKMQVDSALNEAVASLKASHEGKWAIPVKDEHLRAVVSNSYLPLNNSIARSVANETGKAFFAWHWFLSGMSEFHSGVLDEMDMEKSRLRTSEIMTDQIAALLCGYSGGFVSVKAMQGIGASNVFFKRITSGITGGLISAFFATLGYNETRQLLHEIHLPDFLSDIISESEHPEWVIGGIYFAMNTIATFLVAREIYHLAQVVGKIPGAIKNTINKISKHFKGGPPSQPPSASAVVTDFSGEEFLESRFSERNSYSPDEQIPFITNEYSYARHLLGLATSNGSLNGVLNDGAIGVSVPSVQLNSPLAPIMVNTNSIFSPIKPIELPVIRPLPRFSPVIR